MSFNKTKDKFETFPLLLRHFLAVKHHTKNKCTSRIYGILPELFPWQNYILYDFLLRHCYR